MGNIAASVLARLKNKSKEQGIPLQQLLNLFCQEEFIRRLSGSNYKENLILKGGFLLYSMWMRKKSKARCASAVWIYQVPLISQPLF